jgi:hypothetical protein
VLSTIEHKRVNDGVHCVLKHPNVTAVTTELLVNVNVAFHNEKNLFCGVKWKAKENLTYLTKISARACSRGWRRGERGRCQASGCVAQIKIICNSKIIANKKIRLFSFLFDNFIRLIVEFSHNRGVFEC